VIDCWPSHYLQAQAESIGHGLSKALLDPSQAVRMEARNCFLKCFYENYPELWYKIVHLPSGVISQDTRMKRTILLQASVKSAPDKENKSVYSVQRSSAKKGGHQRTPIIANKTRSTSLREHPRNIHTPKQSKTFQTPKRSKKFNTQVESELYHKAACSIQATVRGIAARNAIIISDQPVNPKPNLGKTAEAMVERRKTMNAGQVLPLPPTPQIHVDSNPENNATSPLGIITPKQCKNPIEYVVSSVKSYGSDRKECDHHHYNLSLPRTPQHRTRQAPETPDTPLLTPSPRGNLRRKSSVVFQNRLKSYKPHVQEHVRIGQDLLAEHKHHIDQLMSTMKIEMDVVSKFESLVKTDLTEDNVLEYFESVFNCVDHRTELGRRMRVELERVSRGD